MKSKLLVSKMYKVNDLQLLVFEGRNRGDFEADRDELLFELDFRRHDLSSLLSLSELELDELSDELLLSSSELDDDDDESLELLESSSELDDDDDDDDCSFRFSCDFCEEDVDVTSFLSKSLSFCGVCSKIALDTLSDGAIILSFISFSFNGDDTCCIKMSYSSIYCFILSSGSLFGSIGFLFGRGGVFGGS